MSATSKWGIGALAAAAIVLAGTIGWKVMPHEDAPPLNNVSATASDPIAALQATVRQDPRNVDAWLALGEGQAGSDDFAAAVPTFRHATTLAPNRAETWSALGEALVKADPRNPFPPSALDAFRKALSIDPKDPRARYFLAVRHDLDGDHEAAIDGWFAILKDTPPGAPWTSDVRRTIEQVARINKIDVARRLAAIPVFTPHAPPGGAAGAAIPGPNAEQLQAAQSLTPTQQRAMAAGMVAQLEARLATDKTNLDGWFMLMRSHVQLDEPEKARAALRAALAANPGAARRLTAEAAALGVPAP